MKLIDYINCFHSTFVLVYSYLKSLSSWTCSWDLYMISINRIIMPMNVRPTAEFRTNSKSSELPYGILATGGGLYPMKAWCVPLTFLIKRSSNGGAIGIAFLLNFSLQYSSSLSYFPASQSKNIYWRDPILTSLYVPFLMHGWYLKWYSYFTLFLTKTGNSIFSGRSIYTKPFPASFFLKNMT